MFFFFLLHANLKKACYASLGTRINYLEMDLKQKQGHQDGPLIRSFANNCAPSNALSAQISAVILSAICWIIGTSDISVHLIMVGFLVLDCLHDFFKYVLYIRQFSPFSRYGHNYIGITSLVASALALH